VRTLVHLSDLHFGCVDAALLDPLRRRIALLNPDLVVVSGDLTQRARTGQFREARAWLDTLPRPRLVVPGNHDVPLYNVFQRFFGPLDKFRRIVDDDVEPAYIDDEIAVVGVNTARSLTFKAGRINRSQVERVHERICDLSEDVTKIVVTHHPFDVPEGSNDRDQIVGRARMALDGLAGCGADVFLSGHLHESHVGHTAYRYRIAGVSALLVQAGTALSTRGRGESNSFNVLRVSPRHIEVDRYAWRDGDFGIASNHAFDHVGDGWSRDEGRNAPR
jgi:3',5'-cyclic AMP phosphodiesterase CpdA